MDVSQGPGHITKRKMSFVLDFFVRDSKQLFPSCDPFCRLISFHFAGSLSVLFSLELLPTLLYLKRKLCARGCIRVCVLGVIDK